MSLVRQPVFVLFSVLLLGGVLIGCGGAGDYRPRAVGQEGVITVVIDSTYWQGEVGETIRNQIGPYINTLPAPERAFEFRQMAITSERVFEQIKAQKNLLFVAPLSDTTNEAQFIRSRLSDEAEQTLEGGGTAVIPRSNVWRRSQQVFYVTADSTRGLMEALRGDAAAIRDTFHAVTNQRLRREMFDRGRQFDLEEQLMSTHGFAVNAQADYRITTDTTDFVWLRRVLPETWRSLFVYYEENADPSTLSPEWIYQRRDSLTERYIEGELEGWVEIDRRRPFETEQTELLGRYGFVTRGLWHMVGENEEGEFPLAMGGPFINYAFYDETQDRIYMIDGMVFAPSFDKRAFLRQLEVIAHTFRTRPEVQTEEQVAENR